ncbi:MAG: hypothetical protein GYB31_18160 [Bacteroidetes bacterium]|nr:hypothetical protein [Bacteroidota bacterium]
MDQEEVLSKIEEKVRKLADRMEALQSENAALREEKNNLKTALNSEREAVGQLKDKLKGAQQALDKQRQDEPEDIKVLRERIEESMKEVDACIEWMQKM